MLSSRKLVSGKVRVLQGSKTGHPVSTSRKEGVKCVFHKLGKTSKKESKCASTLSGKDTVVADRKDVVFLRDQTLGNFDYYHG